MPEDIICLMIDFYVKKRKRFQINNLPFHLKKLEREEQTKPKASRRKEIIHIIAEISKT